MVFLPSMQSYIVLQAHVYALFASDARFARTRRTRIYWGWCNPYLFLYLSVRQVFVGKRYTTPIWKFKKEQLNVGLWWGFKQLDCNGNSVTLRDTAVLAIDNNSIYRQLYKTTRNFVKLAAIKIEQLTQINVSSPQVFCC